MFSGIIKLEFNAKDLTNLRKMQKTAYKIIQKLQNAGYLAYLAGGSVRDMLLGNLPQDYDIATSATPDEIEKILPKTIPIGKKFGVILAIENQFHFEIATFRSDSGYSDGRRPDAVYFTSPKKDALRRDFTINGLFYDPIKNEYLDFVDGQKDLANKILRFIGNPYERIEEDKLRILRAVRFKNRFNFKFDSETQESLQKNAQKVQLISQERIGEELNKILKTKNRVQSILDLSELGILKFILPEIEALKNIPQPTEYHQEGGVFKHTLMALGELKPNADLALIWGVFLHDTGKRETFVRKSDRIHFDGHAQKSKEIVFEIARRLRLKNLLRNKIAWLVEHHMQVGQILEMKLSHRIKLYLHPWFEDLLELHRCDESGSIPCELELYYALQKDYSQFKSEKLLTTSLSPLLTGNEIMEIFHLKAGPEIGKYLQIIHEEQLEGKIKTKKEAIDFLSKAIFQK